MNDDDPVITRPVLEALSALLPSDTQVIVVITASNRGQTIHCGSIGRGIKVDRELVRDLLSVVVETRDN